MPIDCGTHHLLNSSGLVHASNTRRAGPLNVRVSTSSRSDLRSTLTRFRLAAGSLVLLVFIDLLLTSEVFDDVVQCAKACIPQFLIPLDPCRRFLEAALADAAVAY